MHLQMRARARSRFRFGQHGSIEHLPAESCSIPDSQAKLGITISVAWAWRPNFAAVRELDLSYLAPWEKFSMQCQLLVLTIFAASALAAGTFDADALPVFRAKCFACHSGKVRSGGLSLETADEILRGGKSGAAIVPGKPMDSLLLTLVAAGKMPANGARLNEAEIAAIRTWIELEDRKPL